MPKNNMKYLTMLKRERNSTQSIEQLHEILTLLFRIINVILSGTPNNFNFIQFLFHLHNI